ncbi:hypothetical protein [Vibrio sp. S9_S30]|nr:hypothetical protein [Vibrio sp. S9_S30]
MTNAKESADIVVFPNEHPVTTTSDEWMNGRIKANNTEMHFETVNNR